MHPPHYLLHRYWGRKAHNIVSHYILKYTNNEELVLDPFQGSGIVIIEALKNHRKAIGVDINPISCLLTKSTIKKIDLILFEKEFKKIFDDTFLDFSKYYEIKCSKCNNNATMLNAVWKEDIFTKLKGECTSCGTFIRNANKDDIKIYNNAVFDLDSLDKKKFFYPKNNILQYVKRSGKHTIDELFTDRALLILSNIHYKILEIKDSDIKDMLLLCFSSMLSSVSKMIPGNENTVTGRSGWVVSKLWVPKIHTEKNIFKTFSDRFKKTLKGKADLYLDIKNAQIYNQSSEKLEFIKSNSVDYVFTDPPYGQSIAYLGLSMFWNSWLQKKINYDEEIIFDPYREKRYEDYEKRMTKVFCEIYRVLKPNKFCSFTFHNRDIKIWKAVMNACENAGLKLQNIEYQRQAVKSGTQGLNRKNTLYGDFVYNFQKVDEMNYSKPRNISTNKLKKIIIRYVSILIKNNNNLLTPDRLYELIIPQIVKRQYYKLDADKVLQLDDFLLIYFDYIEKKIGEKYVYGWSLKLI